MYSCNSAKACRFPLRDNPSVGGLLNSSEEVPVDAMAPLEDYMQQWWEADGLTELVGADTPRQWDVGGMEADVPWVRQVQDFQEELNDTQATLTLGSQDSNTYMPKV
jgi:hypothetical protein